MQAKTTRAQQRQLKEQLEKKEGEKDKEDSASELGSPEPIKSAKAKAKAKAKATAKAKAKAAAKAKAKAKSKASAPTPKAKAKGKAKAKPVKKTDKTKAKAGKATEKKPKKSKQVLEDEADLHEDGEPELLEEEALSEEESAARPPQSLGGRKRGQGSDESLPKRAKNEASKDGAPHAMKQPKPLTSKNEGANRDGDEESTPSKKLKTPNQDKPSNKSKADRSQTKATFARRWQPDTEPSKSMWKAMRCAFDKVIRNKVYRASTLED